MPNIAAHPSSAPLIYPQIPVGEEERVNRILSNFEQHLGFIPDGLRLYSISPPLLETFAGNIGYFNMGGTELPPVLTAMIRYQISWNAHCSYCIDLNEGFLTNLGMDLDDIRASRDNPDAAAISEREKTLLKLAIKSAESPEKVTEVDVDAARKQGWSDRAIFDAVVQATSNRAFNNILCTFNIEHQGAFI